MKLENQVCSPELAKKLKELGVKAESLFAYYGNAGTWYDAIVDMDMYKDADASFREAKLLPAYTAAELGQILIEAGRGNMPHYVHGQKCWAYHAEPDNWIEADTEANARAKMLIYLLENKLITL